MRRDHDCLILGTFVGVGLSFVMSAAMFGNAQLGGVQLVIAAVACTVWGALVGMLMDIVRHGRQRPGRLQFGMWPLLLSFTILILTSFLLSMF